MKRSEIDKAVRVALKSDPNTWFTIRDLQQRIRAPRAAIASAIDREMAAGRIETKYCDHDGKLYRWLRTTPVAEPAPADPNAEYPEEAFWKALEEAGFRAERPRPNPCPPGAQYQQGMVVFNSGYWVAAGRFRKLFEAGLQLGRAKS